MNTRDFVPKRHPENIDIYTQNAEMAIYTYTMLKSGMFIHVAILDNNNVILTKCADHSL